MKAEQLTVFAARWNPLRWQTPHRIYREWVEHILDSGAKLVVIELTYGDREFACEMPHLKNFTHIGVRAKTWAWSKENLLNIGVWRTPEARYICWCDADVFFRRAHWAVETVEALQHYDVVQPWSDAYDLGPVDEHIQHYKSFLSIYHAGKPVVPNGTRWWDFDGGPYAYPHCLTGDSRVVPGGRVIAASARPYEGDLVVIRTAGGQEFSCSPNHPILSGDRWLRADQLNVGDYVFRHVRGNGVPGQPDEQQAPARIDDMVRAFSERRGVDRTTYLLPDDLDNRRANSKVAQVWADRHLATVRDTGGIQASGDFQLGRIIQVQPGSLNSLCSHDFLDETFGFSFAADQSTHSADLAALFRGSIHEHALADRRADFLTPFSADAAPGALPTRGGDHTGNNRFGMGSPDFERHHLANDASGMIGVHADNPGALRRWLAAQIEPDQVVYVGRRKFSGQLYDLQTEYGYIITDRVITHNSGYCWAWTRQAYDWVGGFFDVAGMGSADHHQALSFVGLAERSMPHGTSRNYRDLVMQWQDRAIRHINYNLGYVHGTVEHQFHGRKGDRGYLSRWGMFVKHGFDPVTDLKRNSSGVYEWAGNKPELIREWDNYMRTRNEDSNTLL